MIAPLWLKCQRKLYVVALIACAEGDQAKFGSKVNAGEKNRILEKVQEISQGINQEAESMKARSMM